MLERVKWSNMYEGRYVTTHFNDGRLFKIVSSVVPDSISDVNITNQMSSFNKCS